MLPPDFPGRDRIYLFVDEILSAVTSKRLNLAKSHQFLTEKITVHKEGEEYGRDEANDQDAFKEIGINETEDFLWEYAKDTAWLLRGAGWENYVNLKQYRRLEQNTFKEKALTFFSLLNPSVFQGFKHVTIAGANLDRSLLYKLFVKQGVKFKNNFLLEKQLRYKNHDDSAKIEICYAIEDVWSKELQEKTHNGKRYLNVLADAFEKEIGNEPFLWMGNLGEGSENLFKSNLAQRLPSVSHGLNEFDQYNNVVILSAYNPTPELYQFLQFKGLTPEEIRIAIQGEAVYQSVMRCSLRTDSKNPVRIFVADKAIAEYLHSIFRQSSLRRPRVDIPEELSEKRGPKKIHKNAGEKDKAYRERQKLEILNAQKDLENLLNLESQTGTLFCHNIFATNFSNSTFKRNSSRSKSVKNKAALNSEDFQISSPAGPPETTGDPQTDETLAVGNLYQTKETPLPFECFEYEGDEVDIAFLEECHTRILDSKEQNTLSGPALFDPNIGEKWRAEENILFLQNIWFDFEDGDLTPESFAEIFPDTEMYAFNSYSHTQVAPRFRVFIPTTTKMTPAAYKLIWDKIERAIERDGYWVGKERKNFKPSGLDKSKRSPTSIFYLPCQAKNPEDSFFLKFTGGDRSPLDPLSWIKADEFISDDPRIDKDDPGETSDQAPDLSRIEAAKAIFRATQPRCWNGNFWNLAVVLKASHMSIWEIESTLREHAAFANTPKDLLKQIPRIIKKLSK